MINDQSNFTVSGDQFIKSRSKFAREIVTRSAGLVEISTSEQDIRPNIDFMFIHRSARDFLTETLEGQAILNHDKTTPKERMLSLMEAYLAMAAFFDPKGYGSETHPCGNESLFSVISQLDWNMKYENNPVAWFLSQLLLSYMNETSSLTSKLGPSSTGFIHQLRRVCQKSRWVLQAFSALKTDFLGVTAQWAFTPWLIHESEHDENAFGLFSASYRTYLIFSALHTRAEILTRWNSRWHRTNAFDTVSYLTRTGSIIPNSRALRWQFVYLGDILASVCCTTTILAAWLELLFSTGIEGTVVDGHGDMQHLIDIVELCERFIELGEDIKNRVIFVFDRAKDDSDPIGIWSLGDYTGFREGLPFYRHQTGLLVDLNVAFLLGAFCDWAMIHCRDPMVLQRVEGLRHIASNCKECQAVGITRYTDDTNEWIIHRPDRASRYLDGIKDIQYNGKGKWTIPVEFKSVKEETQKTDNNSTPGSGGVSDEARASCQMARRGGGS